MKKIIYLLLAVSELLTAAGCTKDKGEGGIPGSEWSAQIDGASYALDFGTNGTATLTICNSKNGYTMSGGYSADGNSVTFDDAILYVEIGSRKYYFVDGKASGGFLILTTKYETGVAYDKDEIAYPIYKDGSQVIFTRN